MRKIILYFALLFLISGCSNQSLPGSEEIAKSFEGDFSSSVKAAFGDSEAEMDILKNGMSISVFVDSPAELSGMGIEISDEHAKVIYNGMEQEIKKDSLPEGTPFLLLEELFDELSDPEEFVLSTGNGNIVAKTEDFSAVLSAEDFSLISAEFPFYKTKFTFSNFRFKAAE